MIPRPKNTDTMEDVLKMQNDYLKHKNEENFQPAAQTISKPPGKLETSKIGSAVLSQLLFRAQAVSFCETAEPEAIRR